MSSPIDQLIDAWRTVDVCSRPIALRADLPLVADARHSFIFASYDEWLAGGGLEKAKNPRFHLGLLPVPYIGDLKRATVFLLMLNPGFEPDDYFAESSMPSYRDAVIRNLRQEVHDCDYPFIYLDPRFAWHSAGKYWRARLEWLARDIMQEQGIGYFAALRDLSRRIACLQLVPYHSSQFVFSDLDGLQSVGLVRSVVSQYLLPATRVGKMLIVATRRSLDWGLADSAVSRAVITYSGSETRAAYLSRESRGGAIIRHFLLG